MFHAKNHTVSGKTLAVLVDNVNKFMRRKIIEILLNIGVVVVACLYLWLVWTNRNDHREETITYTGW
jgi:hypothetical protein